MRRFIYVIMGVIAISVILTGCDALTGPQGEQGPPGEDGEDGDDGVTNISVHDLVLTTSAHEQDSQSDNVSRYIFEIDEITNQVVNGGSVNAFWETGDGLYTSLPISYIYDGYIAEMGYSFSAGYGYIRFYHQGGSAEDVANNYRGDEVRFVVIPGDENELNQKAQEAETWEELEVHLPEDVK